MRENCFTVRKIKYILAAAVEGVGIPAGNNSGFLRSLVLGAVEARVGKEGGRLAIVIYKLDNYLLKSNVVFD